MVAVATNSRAPLGPWQSTGRSKRIPWRRRWPTWAPFAAAVWGVLYAAVQLAWAATGTTVPWADHTSYAPAVQLLLAALAVLAGGVCLASTRTLGRAGRATVAGALIVAIAVFGLGTAGLPMYVVTVASGSGLESATGPAQVLLNTVGAGLLVPVGVSYRRRLRGWCPRCGQAHGGGSGGPLAHPAASTASARTRMAVYLLMCGIVPWAGVKSVWTSGGDALGVTAAAWRREMEAGASGPVKALASVGVDVTVLAAMLGGFLLLGLMYPWGQVFPRWTPLLAGRRVTRLLPLIPAWLTAATLSVYGVALTVLAPLSAIGVLPRFKPSAPFTTGSGLTWMVEFGGLAFAGLGIGLVVATRSYAARSRPVCVGASDARE